MVKSIKYCLHSEKGFALIAAIIACVILIALGALVVALSTGDIKTSSRVVGDKRAMAAVEKGIHRMMQNFVPNNPVANEKNFSETVADDLAVDTHSRYEIVFVSPGNPRSMIGYDLTKWGMTTLNMNVTGQNTLHNTRVTIGVGVGYGPVDSTLVYK